MSKPRVFRRAPVVAASGTSLCLALGALVAAPATAVPGTAVCSSIVQLVVRGSTEAAGTSPQGNIYRSGGLGMMAGVASTVAAKSRYTVRTAGINYPATIMPSATSAGYLQSLNIGRDRLAAEMRHLTATCANTRIVLIGYSQGAHVIGDVLSTANPEGLSATVRGRVKAVFLTGDPTRRKGEPFNNGSGVGGGLLPNRGAGQLSLVANRLQSYCYKGDSFCDPWHPVEGTAGSTIHQRYGDSYIKSTGSNFILSKLG